MQRTQCGAVRSDRHDQTSPPVAGPAGEAASLLLGIDGLAVERVEVDAFGGRVVT
jgi:hypothetical protein